MNGLRSAKIHQHRASGGDRRVAKFGVLRDAPRSQQPTNDNPRIKEICETQRPISVDGVFEWESLATGAPCRSRQKAGRAQCRFKVCVFPEALMEKHEQAYRVAGDLVGNTGVLAQVAAEISGHPAV